MQEILAGKIRPETPVSYRGSAVWMPFSACPIAVSANCHPVTAGIAPGAAKEVDPEHPTRFKTAAQKGAWIFFAVMIAIKFLPTGCESTSIANYPALKLDMNSSGMTDLQVSLKNTGTGVVTGWKLTCDVYWKNQTIAFSKSLIGERDKTYIAPNQSISLGSQWWELARGFSKPAELDARATKCTALATSVKATNSQGLPLKAVFTVTEGPESRGELFGYYNISVPTIVHVTLVNHGTKDFSGHVKVACMQASGNDYAAEHSAGKYDSYELSENLEVAVNYSTDNKISIPVRGSFSGLVAGKLKDASSETASRSMASAERTTTQCWIQ